VSSSFDFGCYAEDNLFLPHIYALASSVEDLPLVTSTAA